MKGIITCEDCEFDVAIYRFTDKQGLFTIPKNWCVECDLLIAAVKKTISDLGIDDKAELIIKPWFIWWWQPLFTHFAWHAPILTINGKLISQGVVPSQKYLIQAFAKSVLETTEN